MNFIKSFLTLWIVLWIVYLISFLIAGDFSRIVTALIVGVFLGAFLSFIVTAWIWSAFLLIDSGKIYYQIIAVLMTGLFGIIILLGIRFVYHNLGFTFLSE